VERLAAGEAADAGLPAAEVAAAVAEVFATGAGRWPDDRKNHTAASNSRHNAIKITLRAFIKIVSSVHFKFSTQKIRQIFWQCPDFKVARLALRGAAGRSATRSTKFRHSQFF
jgi:hypothetical protein